MPPATGGITGAIPYAGYDDVEQSPFLFDGDADGRLRAMARVVGVHDGDDAVAVQLEQLLEAGVLEAALAGRDLRVAHVDTFWFAWAAFLPETEVVPPPE